MSKISVINAGVAVEIDGIYNGAASVTDEVNGEYTFSCTLYSNLTVNGDTVIGWNGNYFDVTKIKRYSAGEAVLIDATAEHVSYRLNDITDETFVQAGTVQEVLTALLADTDFTAGSCLAGDLDISYRGANKRAELISIAGEAGGELVYDGYTISIVAHRGATTCKDIYGSENYYPGRPEVNIDVIKNTAAYTVPLLHRGDLETGDNIRLKYTPYDLDVNTRIIKMIYNPYDAYVCQIAVGDYEPDIIDKYIETTSQQTTTNEELASTIADMQSTGELQPLCEDANWSSGTLDDVDVSDYKLLLVKLCDDDTVLVCVNENGQLRGGANWVNADGNVLTYAFSATVGAEGVLTYVNSGYMTHFAESNHSVWTQLAVESITGAGSMRIAASGSGSSDDPPAAQGLFIIVGPRSTYRYSEDGVTWSTSAAMSGTSYALLSVAYGNGKYVAGGTVKSVFTSTDGQTWTYQYLATAGADDSWGSITFGDGKFIAASSNGYFSSSIDGVNWSTPVRPSGGALYSCVGGYFNGKFIFSGHYNNDAKIYYSTDGVNWVLATSVGRKRPSGMCYKDGTYYLAFTSSGSYSTGCLVSSLDGIAWNTVTVAGNTRYKVLSNPIVVGDSLVICCVQSTTSNLYKTLDGISWDTVYPYGLGQIKELATCNGIIVATDGSNTMATTDYTSWSPVQNHGDFAVGGIC